MPRRPERLQDRSRRVGCRNRPRTGTICRVKWGLKGLGGGQASSALLRRAVQSELLAESGSTLDEEACVELLESEEQEGVGSVTLMLKDGTSIRGGEIVLSKTVKVKLTHGVPDCGGVDHQLKAYLLDLMDPSSDGGQVIDDAGRLGADLCLVQLKSEGDSK